MRRSSYSYLGEDINLPPLEVGDNAPPIGSQPGWADQPLGPARPLNVGLLFVGLGVALLFIKMK